MEGEGNKMVARSVMAELERSVGRREVANRGREGWVLGALRRAIESLRHCDHLPRLPHGETYTWRSLVGMDDVSGRYTRFSSSSTTPPPSSLVDAGRYGRGRGGWLILARVGGFEVFAVYSAAIRVREWPQLLAFCNFHGEGRLRYYSSSVTERM